MLSFLLLILQGLGVIAVLLFVFLLHRHSKMKQRVKMYED